MKITRRQLRSIIKETVAEGAFSGAELDIKDAIQMLEAEEDPTGTLFHVINRLYEALEKLR